MNPVHLRTALERELHRLYGPVWFTPLPPAPTPAQVCAAWAEDAHRTHEALRAINRAPEPQPLDWREGGSWI
jgi:hypothetical protein